MARKKVRIAVASQRDSDRRLQMFSVQTLSFLVMIAVAVVLILLST
jgi:hypothetical protein